MSGQNLTVLIETLRTTTTHHISTRGVPNPVYVGSPSYPIVGRLKDGLNEVRKHFFAALWLVVVYNRDVVLYAAISTRSQEIC